MAGVGIPLWEFCRAVQITIPEILLRIFGKNPRGIILEIERNIIS
jgi:hypothetical protein